MYMIQANRLKWHVLFLRGEQFRPAYQALGELRSHLDNTPFAMLTATCSEEIKMEMFRILYLREDEVTTISRIPDRLVCQILTQTGTDSRVHSD